MLIMEMTTAYRVHAAHVDLSDKSSANKQCAEGDDVARLLAHLRPHQLRDQRTDEDTVGGHIGRSIVPFSLPSEHDR